MQIGKIGTKQTKNELKNVSSIRTGLIAEKSQLAIINLEKQEAKVKTIAYHSNFSQPAMKIS